MQITTLDHLVLTVEDIAATCEFYHRVLGFEVITFDGNRKSLRFGDQKINLHRAGAEFQPCAGRPTAGSADLCFVTDTPIETVIEHFKQCDIVIETGPVDRTGARGPIRSVYIRDPDDNLLELSNYT
ncbi:MAG: VOC family protein [Desulfofustis sp.]|jgi:catechol 2,3-dioxygenase-like lactoylglutathione lyase family enzyme